MEENNKKRKGIFYAVVGITVLAIAVIGATFAYFSASTGQRGAGTVAGETQYIDSSALTLTINRVTFNGTTADYDGLVPAYFGKTGNTLNVASPSALGASQVTSMISSKCEQDGFTGCHVYKIDFKANQDIAHANLLLNLSVGNNSNENATAVVDKSQWGYALFTETGIVADGETTGLSLLTGNGVPGAIGNGVTGLDIHNNGSLTANNMVTYYLLVYVNDTDVAQNAVSGSTGDANYVVGSYNGSLELQALGGKVRATFEEQLTYTDINDFNYYIGNDYQDADWRSEFGSETDNYVFLTGYKGSDEVIRIPSSYNINGNEYIPVVYTNEDYHIGVFYDTSDITEAHFSNGVLFASYSNEKQVPNLMRATFSYCTSLVNVTGIPSSVTNMESTFYGCTGLVSAPVIPNSVTDMWGTFYGCTSLVNAPAIPNSVINMQETFLGCTSLVNAPVIPNSVTVMWGTFNGCTSLVNAPAIPSSVTTMAGAFSGCTSLSGTVTINSSNVENRWTTFEAWYPFYGTVNNITVDVPEGSTTYNSINYKKPANVTLTTH